MVRELEKRIDEIEKQMANNAKDDNADSELLQYRLKKERAEIIELSKSMPPEDKVYIARHAGRPGSADYIKSLFKNFFEQRGDRKGREDPAILGGIALYEGKPVTVIGHRKGRNLEENKKFNFGMPGPEGYRKAQRLMEQAEKFKRPVITFIDTPGAYPGIEAEAFGQGEAIASTLALMSRLTVPVISIVIGEGGSGGALAIGLGNKVLMMENAIYSVLSPEGFASILWRDASRSVEASRVMKLTAKDLLRFGVIDEIIPEPPLGAHRNPELAVKYVGNSLSSAMKQIKKISFPNVQRYKKYRSMGNFALADYSKEDKCRD